MKNKTNKGVFDKDGKPLNRKMLEEMLEQMKDTEEAEFVDITNSNMLSKEKEQPTNPALAEDEAKKKIVKVNIACGQNKQEGFIGIDKIKTSATDIVHNLDDIPWPFDDNFVDEILCSHYVEHVKDLIVFMDEIWRIMKVGGKLTIVAPYHSSIRCWQDPTHVRAISEFSFLYFNKKWREDNKLDHYGIRSDFDFVYGYQIDPAWATRAEEARVFAMKHYWNVITDIHVTLTKK